MNFKQFQLKDIFHTAVYAVFGIFILSFFIYFLNYHYHIVASPYPLEYREGAQILPTEILLEGKNPFDYSNNPQSTNIYGFFNNLLIFPFAKICGASILLHRLVAGFFLIACCMIIINVLRKNKTPFLLSCAAGVMLYPFLLFPGSSTPIAGPHSLGMFLFLMTFFVPYFFSYSERSLIISILCGVLAFYTKPYFLLGIPLTASYIFLFKSKRNGFLYGLIFSIIFILSIYIATRAMNCYFSNVFFGMFGTVQSEGPSVGQAVAQLKYFYQLQRPLFLLIGIYFIIRGVLYIKNFENMSFKESFLKLDLFTWREPLFKWDFNVNLYGLIITTLTIYFILGRNTGQFMPYLYHLMSPFFILYVFNCLDKQRSMSSFVILYVFNRVDKQRFITLAGMAFGMALVVLNLFTLYSHFPKNFHEFDKNWDEVEGFIATNKNIFASPYLVPLLIKYHRPVYDSGQSEYFQYGQNRDILNFKSPPDPEVRKRMEDYSNVVRTMLSQKKFDLLIIVPGYHPYLPDDFILYYRPLKEIRLVNFQNYEEFTVIVLVPK